MSNTDSDEGDTIEVRRDEYEQFMSNLDGMLNGLYGNGYDEQIRRLDDLRSTMRMDGESESVTHGHVEWNHHVPEEFVDLFIETVEQSEFMTTEWEPTSDHEHDRLIIEEVR